MICRWTATSIRAKRTRTNSIERITFAEEEDARRYVEGYLAKLEDQPLVLSFKQCLDVLPIATQVQLVEALEAAHVAPSSPAWLLFSVVAELIKELELLRTSLTAAIRDETASVSQILRESLRHSAATIAREERERHRRSLVRYRRFDRIVVVAALGTMLAAFIALSVLRAVCRT